MSSPNKNPRRQQSPSPEPPSPRKITPSKRTRTPRKDTPKKRNRLQCRNVSCRDYFSSTRARDRHENEYCKFRRESGSNLSCETFSVPSHIELELNFLSCRVCPKSFGSESSRKRHELDSHRLHESQGRTFSPVRLDILPARPQSCPPPSEQQPEL